VTNYSYSRLSQFRFCPFAYKLCYLDRVRVADNVEPFTGKRVHEALERLHSLLRAGSDAPLDEVMAFYSKKWDETWSAGISLPEGATAQEFRDKGVRCIKNYFYSHSPFDDAETLSVERRVSTRLGAYPFIGVVDRIALRPDGVHEVHDYKTNAALPEESYFAEDFQLPLYQLALQREFGWNEVELVWDFVALDREVRVRKSTASLEKAERTALSLVHSIEETMDDNIFLKNDGSHCKRCAYAAHCNRG